ncbi:MAG: DNA polymerase III subunit delta [Bacilli bacterium]|nr:DNA polymerase III subunit delta [Bacilli bacterium]
MIYLIYGNNNFLINKEIKKIIANNSIENININKFDLSEVPFIDVFTDFETISLFEDNKITIVDNSLIFTSNSKITFSDDDEKKLLSYIDNPNPHTIVIFTVNNEKLDERKKITKAIKNKYQIIECNKIDNINNYVMNLFSGYQIDNNTIKLLIDRVGIDLGMIEQEIVKIKLYKDNETIITIDDINNLTTKNINTDIFNFIETIILRKKMQALEIYNEFIKMGEEPIKVISMLASNIRIIYQTKELTKKGYSEKDIAAELDIHPYRVKLAKEKSRAYTSQGLIKLLSDLANLDINIKTGVIDKYLGLELFIINI